jgi:hypothetical protein
MKAEALGLILESSSGPNLQILRLRLIMRLSDLTDRENQKNDLFLI